MTPPTRYALVPVEATQAMSDALVDEVLPIAEWSFQGDYERMLSASPNGGCVSSAQREAAACDVADLLVMLDIIFLEDEDIDRIVSTVLTALGLAVSDETQRGEAVDG